MFRLGSSGPFWMVVSCLCFSTMGVFVKLGSGSLSTAELMFYRALTALLVMLVTVIIPKRYSLRPPGGVVRLHFGRSLCGAISMMMGTYAMAHLPLATAVTLQNTSPFFLVPLLAIFYRALPQPVQVFSLALGFGGVVLLLQPTVSSDSWFAGAMGLLSGLFTAGSMFNISELGKAGEPEWRVVFYFLVTSTVVSGLWMLLQSQPMAALDLECIGIIIAMGVWANLGQMTITRAYSQGKSLVVAGLGYLTVVFTSIYGVLIWNDRLALLSYLAMLLIVVAGVLSALRSRQ